MPRSTSQTSIDTNDAADEGESSEGTIALMPEIKGKIDRIIRLHHFQYHSRLFWPAIIRETFGPDVDYNDPKYSTARTKITENMRTYKSRMLRAMESHVTTVLTANPNLKTASKGEVKQHFINIFNPENFYEVWYYMVNIIDVEKSTELGQYYMRGMYVNIALACVPVVKMVMSGGLGVADLRAKAQEVSSLFVLCLSLR